MSNKKEALFVKYLTKEANYDELEQLVSILEEPKNKTDFDSFVKVSYFADLCLKEFDANPTKQKISECIKLESSKSFSPALYLNHLMRYAAVLIVSICLFTFFSDSTKDHQLPKTPSTHAFGSATLTLNDGSQVILKKETEVEHQNFKSKGNALFFEKSKEQTITKIEYNYLTIPKGGQFMLTLADGTKVWLNSESRIKFPTAFIKGEAREVELVYGEAYFDVSHSDEHNGSLFRVLHAHQDVEVLGTSFNIKAYTNETSIYTTLVQGKVVINYSDSKRILLPNQQATIDLQNGIMETKTVDTRRYVAWINGEFVFQSESLEEIARVLSRWYDVKFTFKNPSLSKITFNGELSKNQRLEEILTLIEASNAINAYEIENKTVTIK